MQLTSEEAVAKFLALHKAGLDIVALGAALVSEFQHNPEAGHEERAALVTRVIFERFIP